MSDLTPTSPPLPPVIAPPEQGDVTGGIIPYKNPHALGAYYLGIFSIIPVVGLVLGCFAIYLGFSGLRRRKLHPVIRGAVHAWIGIVCGGLSVLVHLLVVAAIIVGIARH
jgi:hypothetical protein